MLKLDLIGSGNRNRSRFVPIVLKLYSINDELIIKPNGHFIAYHSDQELIPFAWLFIGAGEGAIAPPPIIPQPTGSQIASIVVSGNPFL